MIPRKIPYVGMDLSLLLLWRRSWRRRSQLLWQRGITCTRFTSTSSSSTTPKVSFLEDDDKPNNGKNNLQEKIPNRLNPMVVSSSTVGSNHDGLSLLRIYNSLSKRVESLSSEKGRGLAWYTCGPTVYAPAHLGHARTYVCFDILRRVLEDVAAPHDEFPPLFVLNITDVDDKILAAAAAAAASTDESPQALAQRYEIEFWRDWDALHCLRPHIVTRVTEHVIPSIVPFIQRIWDQGFAYVIDSPQHQQQDEDGVYFDVRAFDDANRIYNSRYGKLAPSPQSRDLLDKAGPPSRKRDVRDFCLWKFRKPGELLYWPSPWGEGRPGWHVECSAMIQAVQELLGDQYCFTVHAGGIDLQFPHHTNEIAQAEAYHHSNPQQQQQQQQQHLQNDQKNGSLEKQTPILSKQEWIHHWVHTGHLHIDGSKMSKSLKNFISIQEFLSSHTPESAGGGGGGGGGAWFSPADDFRMWCLSGGSYRGPVNYTPQSLAEARFLRCEKICQFLEQGHEWLRNENKSTKVWDSHDHKLFQTANSARYNSRKALLSDLDGTTFVREVVRLADAGSAYLRQHSQGPQEVVLHVLQTIRGLLQLVGFSEITCQAGLHHNNESSTTSSGVVGGERALLEEMVRFRKSIRDLVLSSNNNNADTQFAKQEILRLCDEARDTVFPALGVELHDGKTLNESESSSWNYCIPRKSTTEAKPVQQQQQEVRWKEIPLKDYFRTGHYEGMFSTYTEDGFPTHDAYGKELSKSLTKKLLKKQQDHKNRLDK